jgi:hypothetical protein
MPRSSKWSFSFRFHHQNHVCIPFLPTHATCSIHIMLVNFTTHIIFCENHTSHSSSHYFLQFPVTAPYVQIHSSAPIPKYHHSLCFSLIVTDQVSNPYTTTRKMIVLYILIFILLGNKWDDRRFWTEWQQAVPEFNLLLIPSTIAQNKSPFEKRSGTTLISSNVHCWKFITL